MTRDTKSAAIRAVLKSAGKALPFDLLHQRVERRLKMVIGRKRLRTLLSVMQTNDGDVRGTGRGDERMYEFVKGKA